MDPASSSEIARHPLPSALLHTLRTPLNQIIGYSEMLIEQAEEQGQHSFVSDLRNAHAAGKQLLAIITDNFYPVHAPTAITLAPQAHPASSAAALAPEKISKE